MSTFPPPISNQPGVGMAPHRGVLVLVLGILGLVLCVFCGIAAWLFGNKDLAEMQAGRMDPSGMQLTKIGKILGIVATALWGVWIVLWVGMMILGAGAAAVGGGRP